MQVLVLKLSLPNQSAQPLISRVPWQQNAPITMSNQGTRSVSKFTCEEPSCNLKTFSTRSNLNRHKKSKHGQEAQMPCGKSLPNHVSNCRRHKDSCQRCRAAVIQYSTPDERTNVGSPVNANEMLIYDYTFEALPASLGDMVYNMDDFDFEAHQSEDHLSDCKV